MWFNVNNVQLLLISAHVMLDEALDEEPCRHWVDQLAQPIHYN